jgi:pyridinium-3,5-bisthiocarboxylic acid mononucleotide nickel chelatase
MPQNLLYLDPWSGLSGDMILAALVDAGGAEIQAVLHSAVASLGLRNVAVKVVRDSEWGISCTRIRVHDEESAPLRHLDQMLEVIDGASLSEQVKLRARTAVTRLAEVEAGIHGCSVDDIHFHEVGAADTLVDVVGTFVLVEALQVGQVFAGTIPVGGGTVEIAHGRMGVPAPATAALLAGYQVIGGPEMRELTTPTGALLVGQLHAEQGPLPPLTVKAVGYGAGTMKLEHGPNVLRVVLGEAPEGPGIPRAGDTVVELQTNIDDVSPEVVGHALRRLRQAGALDAWTTPAHMKKDRPGMVVHVLAAPGDEARLVDLVFTETGTLGVRRSVLARYVADRGAVSVSVAGNQVAVKWGRWDGRLVTLTPEYEDAAAAAAAAGLPLREIMHRAGEAARRSLEQGDEG